MNKMKPQIDAGMAKSWSHCPRHLWYDVYPPEGFETEEDPFEQLIADAGIIHEKAILAKFPQYVEAKSAEHTKELISNGVPVIYQPILLDPKANLVGRPDFLIRTDDGTYQVADAKLALSLNGHTEIKLQLGTYLKLLNSELPALVYLGNQNTEEVDKSILLQTEKFLANAKEILSSNNPPDTHFSDSKCKQCPYDKICRPQFEKKQEITICYGIDSRSKQGLLEQGITNLLELSQTDPNIIKDVPYLKGFDKKSRAVIQAKSYLTGEVFQVQPLNLPKGTWVHFDLEANPLGDINSVYLWGWIEPPYDNQAFKYTWSDGSPGADNQAWISFLNEIENLKARIPNLVLVHFTNYEVTQIKSYAKKYEMENHPTVTWLLGENSPLFDIQVPIKESLILPLVGYGLKVICKDKRLVNFQWELSESGSQWSVVRYIDYLKCNDEKKKESIKNEILSYNRDDVMATRAVEIWLMNNFKKQNI